MENLGFVGRYSISMETARYLQISHVMDKCQLNLTCKRQALYDAQVSRWHTGRGLETCPYSHSDSAACSCQHPLVPGFWVLYPTCCSLYSLFILATLGKRAPLYFPLNFSPPSHPQHKVLFFINAVLKPAQSCFPDVAMRRQ